MHFEALGVPKHSPDFDSAHFCRVMSFVEDYNKAESDDDTFLYLPFSRDEVSKAYLTSIMVKHLDLTVLQLNTYGTSATLWFHLLLTFVIWLEYLNMFLSVVE